MRITENMDSKKAEKENMEYFLHRIRSVGVKI
jgi:hypothetical protein